METVWQPRCAVDIEIPADRVCSVFFQRIERIYGVSFGFAHLLPVLILYVAEDDHVLVRRFIKYQCRDCQQGVEPSTGLVHSLGYKVSRELLLEQFLIFKWVVVLCKWHGSRVKPAVDHLRNTMHLFAADRTLNGNRINVWAVKLDIFRAVIRHFLQFRDASDGMLVTALALPDIQRSSPITVPADAPILDIFKPVPKTLLSNTLRDPVDRIIVCDQIILYLRHLDEPRFPRIVKQRRITSPAVWITMLELRCVK